MDWLKFQVSLEAGLTSAPVLPNEVSIDACEKEMSSAISKALTDSNPNRPRADPRPPIPARIQDEKPAVHAGPCFES